MCVCVCVYILTHTHTCIYIYIHYILLTDIDGTECCALAHVLLLIPP